MLRRLLMIALFAVSAPAFAELSDIWWNPNESGWGINMIQNEDVIFATMFVYGTNGVPTWYGGILNRDATTGRFAGSLFQSTGPYFGATTFDPGQVAVATVGSMSFAPGSASDTGVLTYNVGAVSVTKNIQRQTLKTIVLGGTYVGGFVAQTSQCSNTANNVNRVFASQLVVTQLSNGTVQLDLQPTNGVTCSLRGTATQVGQLFRIPNTTYTCTTGLSTSAVVYGLKQTAQGIEGQWQASTGGNCIEDGRFSAVF